MHPQQCPRTYNRDPRPTSVTQVTTRVHSPTTVTSAYTGARVGEWLHCRGEWPHVGDRPTLGALSV